MKKLRRVMTTYPKSLNGFASLSLTNCCERWKREPSPNMGFCLSARSALLSALGVLGAFAGLGALLTMTRLCGCVGVMGMEMRVDDDGRNRNGRVGTTS